MIFRVGIILHRLVVVTISFVIFMISVEPFGFFFLRINWKLAIELWSSVQQCKSNLEELLNEYVVTMA